MCKSIGFIKENQPSAPPWDFDSPTVGAVRARSRPPAPRTACASSNRANPACANSHGGLGEAVPPPHTQNLMNPWSGGLSITITLYEVLQNFINIWCHLPALGHPGTHDSPIPPLCGRTTRRTGGGHCRAATGRVFAQNLINPCSRSPWNPIKLYKTL